MSDAPLCMAIDQGGHASRAMVFDERGTAVAGVSVPVETRRPGPGRVEHDAEALLATVREAVDGAAGALGSRLRDLRVAGLATQRSSIVCWDREGGEALTPVLSWQDVRGAAWLERFASQASLVKERSGLVLSPHYGASKLRWCLDHVPAVRAARAGGRLALGPLASFLVFRLTRERSFVADGANAARTLLYDLQERDWSPALLDLFEIPRDTLPRCVPCRHEFGTLGAAGRDVPCAAVTGDQSAALFARGAPEAEACYVNVGTGAFVQRLTGSSPIRSRSLLAGLVWDDAGGPVHTLEGTVNGAGSALEQVGRELGLPEREVARRAETGLTETEELPLFLNGVGGLGSPWWRSDFESRFVPADAPADARLAAVVESIAFLVRTNLEHMETHLDPPRRLVVSGGLATSDGLCRRLAGLSGVPVERPPMVEATACGLAFLLGAFAGASERPEVFEPRADATLRARYRRWREAMPAVHA